MATYTYETSDDEEAALDLEVLKINGQLAAQNKPPLDKKQCFKVIVADKFKPLAQQLILAKVSPIIQKFIDGDETVRAQILASADAVAADVVIP